MKAMFTRCGERQREVGLDSLLLGFTSILACLSNGEKAPEELICMRTSIFFFFLEGGPLCPFR